ncbi:gamma-glutamyltransferase [Methyloceanibacter sp.]|uniref:gamma-glutamyltransferase n=1 Tax=Methyloceanibacter sp. TaxID=1965321 RepID=UPI003D6CFA5E
MRKLLRHLVFYLFAAALTSTASEWAPHVQALEMPEGASGFTPKPLVTAKKHMVVAAHPLAAEAGLAMLRQGGSAIDAGIAAQMVLNLVEPQSSGLGGGAFMLYWDAAAGTLSSYDGRETAPAAAAPELFLDESGAPLPRDEAIAGGLSVGVPGVLAALKLVHDEYGKLPWAELFQPAIALAREGFPVSARLSKMLADMGPEHFTPDARAYFFDPEGRPRPAGDKLTNEELAETFEMIALKGHDVFYNGDIARDIARAVQSDPRHAGRLTIDDLANYRAKKREAVCAPYRSRKVCGAGPPSSGAIAVGQVVGIVEPFDLGTAPFDPRAAHLIAEAERLAYADRARYVADPDFVAVPVSGLLDPDYLAERRALIDPNKAQSEVTAGTPPEVERGAFGIDATNERGGTSQVSVVDADGDAFSLTTSIEYAFGARTMVRGFLLNNQLTDFSFLPGDSDGHAIANRVEPGKRPRSTMNPTMVFGDDGNLDYVLGSPGGPAIIFFNLKALFALIDWQMDAAEAAALVNFGSTEKTVLIEPGAAWDALAASLEAKGHKVRRMPMASGQHIIAVTPDGLEGGADPRRDSVALGD